MTSDDDIRDTPMDRLREVYAEGELDHDRNPTEDGFVQWLARQVQQSREADPSTTDDVLAEGWARTAAEMDRDALSSALAGLIDEVCIEIGTPEYRDRVLAEVERARAVLHAVRGDQG